MKAKRKIDEKGHECTTNWMLNECDETCKECQKKNNTESVGENAMIVKQTIQKIEYGRKVLTQFFIKTQNMTNEERSNYYKKFESDLCEKITELEAASKNLRQL